jgi:glutathione S-transferase
MMSAHILYSFRRCPYAIRARMALAYAGIVCELREVSLRCKPAEMLAISPKGTTPVLQLANGCILEESLDIMYWATQQNEPEGWAEFEDTSLRMRQKLIAINDLEFKQNLDRYKYFQRFPEAPQEVYRCQAEVYLQTLESLLQQHQFLLYDRLSIADVAIFPFVRQFAHVDLEWFESAPYKYLQQWLSWHEASQLFQHVMQKHEVWQPEQPVVFLTPVDR